MISKVQFATKIKEKYPVYNKIPDEKLANHVLEKYPKYKLHVSTNAEDSLAVIRHGETNMNEEDKARGWDKVSLNPDGKSDANKAGTALKDEGITKVISSDLPRAKETANIIAKLTGADIVTNPDLRTWDIGKLAGKDVAGVQPQLDDLQGKTPNKKPPGGESYNEFKARVEPAIQKIKASAKGEKTALVVHNEVAKLMGLKMEPGEHRKIKI